MFNYFELGPEMISCWASVSNKQKQPTDHLTNWHVFWGLQLDTKVEVQHQRSWLEIYGGSSAGVSLLVITSTEENFSPSNTTLVEQDMIRKFEIIMPGTYSYNNGSRLIKG